MEQETNEETLDQYIERMEKQIEVYSNGTTHWDKIMLVKTIANLLTVKQLKDIQDDTE